MKGRLTLTLKFALFNAETGELRYLISFTTITGERFIGRRYRPEAQMRVTCSVERTRLEFLCRAHPRNRNFDLAVAPIIPSRKHCHLSYRVVLPFVSIGNVPRDVRKRRAKRVLKTVRMSRSRFPAEERSTRRHFRSTNWNAEFPFDPLKCRRPRARYRSVPDLPYATRRSTMPE